MLWSITRISSTIRGTSMPKITVRTGFKLQISLYSTNSKHIRVRPRIRDLIKTPVAKSLILTFIFGTFVVDLMKNRKELELLERTYNSKFSLLEGLCEKLKQGEQVDVASELRIANSLTKYKYNTVTEIELDEQLENFLKMTEEQVVDEINEVSSKPIDKASFL